MPGKPRRLAVVGGDAPSARAAWLASSAALPARPGVHGGRGGWTYASPYAGPTRTSGVPRTGWAADHRWSRPLRGVERPRRKVRFARLIHAARPRSWRTCGPRRLRRQYQPALVATDGGPVARPASPPQVAPAGPILRLSVGRVGGRLVVSAADGFCGRSGCANGAWALEDAWRRVAVGQVSGSGPEQGTSWGAVGALG
jgi:hypothetical protein